MTTDDGSWRFLESGANTLGPVYDDLSHEELECCITDAPRRRAGSLMGAAVGDALGAPDEFKPSRGITPSGTSVNTIGGDTFSWEPGAWTDDISMMIPMLLAFRDIDRYDFEACETEVVRGWRRWARSAPDVGKQTRAVLGMVDKTSTATDAFAVAALATVAPLSSTA